MPNLKHNDNKVGKTILQELKELLDTKKKKKARLCASICPDCM